MPTPNPQAEPVLKLRGVTKNYHMGEVIVTALEETDLDIQEGEFLVILGPSGSGKSTLVNLVGGMDRPTAGDIYFRGEDITDFSDRELTRYRREQIGFIFQFFSLVTNLTALENVQLAVEVAEQRRDPREVLDLVGLADRADHFPAQLSGGEQQRVAVARAIAKDPAVILCDEPTGSLDYTTGQRVLSLLQRLNLEHGKTIMVITHNVPISQMAHRVVHLRSGYVDRIEEREEVADAAEIRW
jgi:putative ABC transport system ATP-binding protein